MLKYFKNKKRLFAFLVVSVAIYWGLMWYNAGSPQIILENNSGQTLQSLTVKFDGVTHDVGELPTGQFRAIDVASRREANLEIRGRMANGTRLHITGHYGVFTHWEHGAMDAKLRVTIGTTGLVTIK